ncbi:MAG: HAD family hydrolase [Lachnospiraceae bacterium]|nr:HAD family hydrolase [Lachnospiraceae bacterium]
MRYKGLIFDFDYTLGDSTEGIVICVNHALEQLGHALAEREAVRKTIGLHLEETYRVLTGDNTEERAAEFSRLFVAKADEIMTGCTRLFPGTQELLEKWKHQGYKIGIVTTKYHYRIDDILKKYQAENLADLIVGGDDVKRPKPDPEGVLQVLGQWHMDKNQVLYVGDSLVDARTAQSAEVDFAGVTTGTTEKEELENYPNFGVFAGLGELDDSLS